jgi:hypothetical protein
MKNADLPARSHPASPETSVASPAGNTIARNPQGLRISFLRISFWCVAIILGAADAWASRFTMNPDGISYLEVGAAYWRGDWHAAINAYWGPLYSWILGLFLKVLKPSPYWEYPVVHLANFVIYVGALACFEFFLSKFIRNCRLHEEGPDGRPNVTLPEWAWWSLAYSLFIWTTLVMISVGTVTPDICVAAFVYLAAGLILRIRSGGATQRDFVLLGIVLGLAYLAKAVMFPLAFVFLAVAALSLRSLRRRVSHPLVSALVFLVIAAPFMAVISRAKGRLTFGDSGRLQYAACVDGVDFWFPGDTGRAQCLGEGGGAEGVDEIESPQAKLLRHPAKRIFDAPAVYQFEGPVGGTYPFWYDPSYWQEGIQPHFDLRGQARALKHGLGSYYRLLLRPLLQLNVFGGLCILYLLARKPSECIRRAAKNWALLLPAIAALILYALVFAIYRYVAPFVLIMWLAAFSGVRIPSSKGSKISIAAVGVFMIATTVGLAAFQVGQSPRSVGPVYWEAATALKEVGIQPGDKVAVIKADDLPFVAHLARVRIVAQVNRPDRFSGAAPSTQIQLLEAIAGSGAKALLVTPEPRRATPGIEWKELGLTNYYVCLLGNVKR